MNLPQLEDSHIKAISEIIGDADNEKGLKRNEIIEIFKTCKIDIINESSKVKTIYSSLITINGSIQLSNYAWRFLGECFKPARGINNYQKYSALLEKTNKVLITLGVKIKDDGKFYPVDKIESLSEAQKRTKSLRNKLYNFSIHENVLKFCSEELLTEDYFHAILEAAKSLSSRVKEKTNLDKDGCRLFQEALSVNSPYMALSELDTESKRNQQRGLTEILCGVTSMVRNVTAHEPRIKWNVNERDAIDILLVISFLHKMLDLCVDVPKSTDALNK